LLTPDQKHQRTVEFAEMTDDDRNVLKRTATVMEVGVTCTIQKQNIRVKLG
jgi:hypothetical protein